MLTTCCASFGSDWSCNAIVAGAKREGLVTVRRFRVGARNRRAFDRANALLLSLDPAELKASVSPLGESDARAFYENGINSPDLYAYLARQGRSYDRILFLPYLYAPTLFGLPLVRERAYLQPCLHDEPYAYLGRVAQAVHAAKGLLFNSEGEFELALRMFGPGIVAKSATVGEGVETYPGRTPERVGSLVPANERFVLYLGRQDPAKGVSTLVRAFSEFKRRQPTSLTKLVLAGERAVSYGDPGKDIIDLGSVREDEKAALLARCLILAQPSTRESFSRVIYEAWLYGRPIAAHRECLATAIAVERSGGGFVADTAAAWEALIARVERMPEPELAALGRRGYVYAREVADWPNVIGRYRDGFARTAQRAPVALRQVTPASPVASAYAQGLAAALNPARHPRPASAASDGGQAEALTVVHLDGEDPSHEGSAAVRIHHGTRLQRLGARSFCASRPAFASTISALEAAQRAGYREVEFLPFPVDPAAWDTPPETSLVAALRDGKHNLLYDGPIASLDHLNDLLIAFLHYLTIEREARLTVLASLTCDDGVYRRLCDAVARLELSDLVLIARDIDDGRRQAIYRCAHAFVCLDAADTPGIGLLRALWFDVPILALRTPTAAALLDDAALLIGDKSDLLAVATLANMLVIDPILRRACIRSQRAARERVAPRALEARLLAAKAQVRKTPA